MMIRGVLCLVLACQQFLIPGLLCHHHSEDDPDHGDRPHLHVGRLVPGQCAHGRHCHPPDAHQADPTPDDHEDDAVYLAADPVARELARPLPPDLAPVIAFGPSPGPRPTAVLTPPALAGPDHPPFYLLHLALLI